MPFLWLQQRVFRSALLEGGFRLFSCGGCYLRFGRFLLFRDGLTRGLSGLALRRAMVSSIAGWFWDVFCSKISVQFIPLARIDVQGVQGAPKASDSNGFDPGHGGWTG